MNKTIIIILTILFLGLQVQAEPPEQKVTTARVEQNLEQQFSFSDAIKYALKNNNDIRAMRNHLCASEKDIGISRSAMLPKLRFLENFTVTNNPIEAFAIKLNQTRAIPGDLAFGTLDYPGATTNFLTQGLIEQRLFDRKALIEITMAKTEYSANGYIFLRKQDELINMVAQEYLAISTNKELISIEQKALDDTKRHLKTAQERYQKKSGFYSDLLRAKTSVEEREQTLTIAQRNLDIAKKKLALLLGLEDSIDISTPIPEIPLKDFQYYKDFSIFRSDVKAMQIKVENAKNGVKHEQAEWYPTLNAVASYNFYNPNYPFGGMGNNYIAGANLRWDIFDGARRNYAVAQARCREAETKEYLEGLKKTVGFKVYEAYSNVQEHIRNLNLAISVLKNAEEDAKRVEQRWQENALPFVALIDAQDNLDKSRISVINNQKDLIEDLINLNFESGIIYQTLAAK